MPHHESTEEEIKSMIKRTKEILKTLPTPNIITLAKSSSDDFDYTPRTQVDFIYESVVAMLRSAYERKIVLELDFDLVLEKKKSKSNG